MTRRLVDTGPRGWLDIGSYARHGPGQRDRLSSAQVAFITRTIRRAPEVMIKMLNQGGRTIGSVARHLKYIDREGELPIETDEGDPLKGKGSSTALLDDWDLKLDAKRPPTADHKPRHMGKQPKLVDDARKDSRGWSALYQQDPAPDDGEYFKREHFQEYDTPPDGLRIYGASDYAVTEGGGDFTEHGIFGFDWTGGIYLLDWWRGQASPDEWIERQCDLIAKWRPVKWFGESGVIRKAVEPFLKRRMSERQALCYLEWLSSIADKPTRARAFQAKVGRGDVFLPKNAPWKADLLGQLLRFPVGTHDDGVDVCSLIGRGLEHARPPEIEKPSNRTPNRPLWRVRGNHPDSWMLG